MDEFRLNIEMYGDAGNFGLLTIFDSRPKAFNPLPQESYSMENATPEAIGKFVTEYLRKYCCK